MLGELKFGENVYPRPYVRCRMSGVTCPMSPVIFCLHASFLKQNEKKKIRKKWTKGWRVCYQWGLPRLIFDTDKKNDL